MKKPKTPHSKRQVPPRFRKAYAVYCHRTDCGDEAVFVLEGAEFCKTRAEDRKKMEADFREMREEHSPERSGGGNDPCTTERTLNGIFFAVPVANERGEDDWILCRWTVVEV